MSPMPKDYYFLPAGPAAKYVGVSTETIKAFRLRGEFQNSYQRDGYWLYRFQDLDHLAKRMREHEDRTSPPKVSTPCLFPLEIEALLTRDNAHAKCFPDVPHTAWGALGQGEKDEWVELVRHRRAAMQSHQMHECGTE